MHYFPAIPRHKFEYFPFEDLHDLITEYDSDQFQKNALGKTIYIMITITIISKHVITIFNLIMIDADAIGVVMELQPVIEMQTMIGLRNAARFHLYDGR